MRAKPSQLEQLLDIQMLDLQARNLEQQIQDLDQNSGLQTAKQEIAGIRVEANESQYRLDDKRLQIEKIVTDVKLVDDRLERDHKLLAGNVSAKDAQSIEAEVESLNQRKIRLEDEQLDLMQDLEEIQTVHDSILEREQAVQKTIDEFDETIRQEKTALQEQQHQSELDRRIIAAAIDPEVLNLYEDRFQRYGMGASLLDGRYSMGAGVELSSEDLAQIAKTPLDEIIFCPITQAILVRKAE